MSEEKVWREVRPATRQQIDWRKVAQELYRASNMSHGLPMRDEVVVRTISHIIAAAIEDGLS